METNKRAPSFRLRFNQTGLTIILIFLLIATLPSILNHTFGAIVTLSVNSATESVEFALKAERIYSWRLPPGTFSLLSVSGGGTDCEKDKYENVLCTFSKNSTLQVSGGPLMTLESLPGKIFALSLIPAGEASMNIKVLDQSGDTLVETNDLAFYESAPKAPETRLPVIVEKAKLGALLLESSADMGAEDSIWQPMLKEGEYAVFASVGSNRERLQILEGEFDAGDVIDMRARSEDETESADAAIWGHVSLSPGDDSEIMELRAILHTPFPVLNVQRFGSAKGYTIKTRPWQIYSKLPFWQSSWVIFVSLLLIYDVYCAAAERNHRWNRHMSGLMTGLRGIIKRTKGAGVPDEQNENPQSDVGRSDA